MVGLNSTISMITFSVNGLNIPMGRLKLSDWIENNARPNHLLPLRNSL